MILWMDRNYSIYNSNLNRRKLKVKLQRYNNQRKAISLLKKGYSLRQIGDRLGIDSKAVFRLGAEKGVYSVRSDRYSA